MFSLRVLGTLALDGPGNTSAVGVLAHAKRAGLLAHLALARPRGFHRRDTLYALLWPESDLEHARTSLRQALHQIRRVLGPDLIANRGDDEVGLLPGVLSCDAIEFEQAVEEGRHADGYALYGGELLPGFFVSEAPAFEEWLEGERARLRQLARKSAWVMAEDLARAGDPAAAAAAARRAAAWEPLDEIGQRKLIELLDRLGDAGGALRAYDEFAERLRAELDAEPAEATAAVVRAIRERSPTLPPPPPWTVPAAVAASPRPRWTRRVGIGAVLAVMALGSATAWRFRASAETPPSDRTLAVLPFTVRGGSHAWLREGMVDLVSAKIEGAAGLHAIDPRSVLGAADSGAPEPAAATARRLGAGRYITGEIVAAGGRLELRATLREVGSGARILASASAAGDTAQILTLVDRLAAQILADLAPGRDTALTRIAAVTTASLPAMRAFLAGEQALRDGRDGAAVAAFQDAATLDTGFALAQYRLSIMATWSYSAATANPALWADRAARRAEHLTPLARDLLTAYRSYRDLRPDVAERMYRSLTVARPDNVEAWLMLGETLFHFNAPRARSMHEALEPFNRALAMDPYNAQALIHVARLHTVTGRLEALDSVTSTYANHHRDAARLVEMRALVAFARGADTMRSRILAEARDADDVVLASLTSAASNWAVDYSAAMRLAEYGTDPVRDTLFRSTAQRQYDDLSLAQGQWEDPGFATGGPPEWRVESQALLAAEPAFPVDSTTVRTLRDRIRSRPWWPHLKIWTWTSLPETVGSMMQASLVGRLSARLRDTAEVRASLARLERLPASGASEERMQAYLAVAIRAADARARGDLHGALAELRRLRFTLPSGRAVWAELSHMNASERFALGEVLLGLGQDSAALPYFESFDGTFDLALIPLAYLRRAEILSRRGDRAQARFHYQRFITMWRNCDPGLRPMVDGARRALQQLGA